MGAPSVDFNEILHKNIRVRHTASGQSDVFHVDDYLPAEHGTMDIWLTAQQGNDRVGYLGRYKGWQLREMGYELPEVTHVNVRDDEMKRLAGKLSRTPTQEASTIVDRLLND